MQTTVEYDFLEFEEDSHLLDFKFDNTEFHMWMFVRSYVLQHIISSQYKLDYPLTVSPHITRKHLFSYFINSLRGFVNYFRKFDFLYLEKSAGCTKKVDGKWFNRVNDYFSTHTSNSLILDHSFNYEFKKPRFPKYTASQDLPKILIDIWGKVFSKFNTRNHNKIDNFISYLNEKHQFDAEFNNFLKGFLRRTSLRIKHGENIYKTILRATSPKILFMEDASYGVESYIIKWAKDLNIKTVEIQHGMISPLYPAYCYGKILSSSVAPKYLPDFLLTYGDYWEKVIKYPAKVISIGNPHFDFSKEITQKSKAPQHSILIVADACNPKKFSAVANFLATHLSKEWIISVKVHPLDAKNINTRFPEILNNPRINIINEGDIFHFLNLHRICITSFSTTLFEALALGITTLIFDDDTTNSHIPNHIGRRFSSNDEILKVLNENTQVEDNSCDIFKENWSDNFDHFLATTVGSAL